ncbi:cwf18 pre-mRNA splicing factor-domain-containing protein [Flammula alnicola]|nr:cwf18 pre-mRNA splicing factor-domain-containing protein [Flammula alnicola]
MSLAEASEARKARLVALRKRKAGEAIDDNGVAEPLIKSRNFDPESRTLKKLTQDDVVMQDTVENRVKGLAEEIIADDEKRRAQELDVFNIAPKRPNWDLKREMAKKLASWTGGHKKQSTPSFVSTLSMLLCHYFTNNPSHPGQRLAAQQGESDDLVGAMKAQEQQNASESLSDEMRINVTVLKYYFVKSRSILPWDLRAFTYFHFRVGKPWHRGTSCNP